MKPAFRRRSSDLARMTSAVSFAPRWPSVVLFCAVCLTLCDLTRQAIQARRKPSESLNLRNSLSRLQRFFEPVDGPLERGLCEQFVVGDPAHPNSLNYSEPSLDLEYESDSSFDGRGMEHLYYVTNAFLRFILPSKILPFDISQCDNRSRADGSNSKTVTENIVNCVKWSEVVSLYAGWISLVAIGVLFTIVTPFAALFFCCCRCAGKCGSRSQPFDKKIDPCRRIMLGIVLSVITIILLFGVVCAFVTNEYLEKGVKRLPDNLHRSLNDTSRFIDNSKIELNHVLVRNYQELERQLNISLDTVGDSLTVKLGEVSQAIAIDNLTSIAAGLKVVRRDLIGVQGDSSQLQDKARQLQFGLSTLRSDLLNLLAKCKPTCDELLEKYDIDQLSVEAQFDLLPSVNTALDDVGSLLQDGIEDQVLEGRDEFYRISDVIQSSVGNTVSDVKKGLRNAGENLELGVKNVTKMVDHADLTGIHETVDTYDSRYVKPYSKYRYYADLALTLILLLIVTCLSFGLFFGFCGKRPDNIYGDNSCSKGTGASFLMSATYLMFFFFWLLMLLTLVHLIIGSAIDQVACNALKNGNNSQVFDVLDLELDRMKTRYSDIPENLSARHLLNSCSQNGSLYEVLQLKSLFDDSNVESFPSEYGISELIDEMKKNINIDPSDIPRLLSNDARSKLIALADSPVATFNFSGFAWVLSQQITSIDLIQLSNSVSETAEKIPAGQRDIKTKLQYTATTIRNMQNDYIVPMTQLVDALKNGTKHLEENLKFNGSSLRDAIFNLIATVDRAQLYINQNATREIVELAVDFTNKLLCHIDDFIKMAVIKIQSDIGRCGPLSEAINATATSVCKKVMNPFNGFWFSFSWCLVLFIPTICICVTLARLYRKTDAYPGRLVEAEALYDAYGDNIPLANVSDKKPPKRGKRSAGSRENHNTYSLDYTPVQHHNGRVQSSYNNSSNDHRYGDIAPRNLNLSHGSAGYQPTSPTLPLEYERPPPYYYPGPGNGQ